jgi:hypothetical protein
MATFNADTERAVAIELKEKMLLLYAAVLPVFQATSQWVLNNTDPMLPAPFDVKVQLASYQALTVEALKLKEWIAQLLTAQPGDTLTYPPPPSGTGTGVADGSILADGSHLADGSGT